LRHCAGQLNWFFLSHAVRLSRSLVVSCYQLWLKSITFQRFGPSRPSKSPDIAGFGRQDQASFEAKNLLDNGDGTATVFPH
jgi:hypothetical protein